MNCEILVVLEWNRTEEETSVTLLFRYQTWFSVCVPSRVFLQPQRIGVWARKSSITTRLRTQVTVLHSTTFVAAAMPMNVDDCPNIVLLPLINRERVYLPAR